VWWVRHDGSSTIGAYGIDEMELQSDPWTTTYDTATIDHEPLTVEQARALDVCRICRGPAEPREHDPFIESGSGGYAHESCLKKQEPSPVEPVEQPLDFEALRDSVELVWCVVNAIETLEVNAADLSIDEIRALTRLAHDAPRLIDMAERCEKAERSRDSLARSFRDVMEAKDQIVAERDRLKEQLAEAVAERDKLKAERAMAQQNPCETQPSGLSEEEKTAIDNAKNELGRSVYLRCDEYRPLLAVIDRLSRQKAVPWKKIRRVEKSGYYFWGSESEAHWGYLNAGSEASEPVYHVSFDDVLATLPKGDVTP